MAGFGDGGAAAAPILGVRDPAGRVWLGEDPVMVRGVGIFGTDNRSRCSSGNIDRNLESRACFLRRYPAGLTGG